VSVESLDDGQLQTKPASIEYEVSVRGGGLAFERTVQESVALQVLAVVMGGGVASPPAGASPGFAIPKAPTGTPPAAGSDGEPPLTVGEFLADASAKSNPDKITAIAAYLKQAGTLRFSPEDIRNQFPQAGEALPANFSRDFRQTVANKWIAPDPPAGKDQYYITATGLAAVRSGFTGSKKAASPRKRASRRKADSGE